MRPKHLITQELRSRVAISFANGLSRRRAAEELSITTFMYDKVLREEETQALIKELEHTSISAAKTQIRLSISQLADKLMSVINMQLDEGNLEAVKIALKVIGFEQDSLKGNENTQLTVIMPGAEIPKIIEVKSENN